jgi:hypothetical protein
MVNLLGSIVENDTSAQREHARQQDIERAAYFMEGI